ncbi:AzlD family protein [uncultured Ramlibacter sp.]|uniref:AzlD family protein n=1 Tax=uncultured Ramlibacter sp. TaxID=260755 RepID=UPI00260E33CC|nr:AzlD domain-containing protein [uncultured Ramlibacter sp.]
MAAEHAFFIALAAMAAASYSCRIAGFVLMRFVPVTPRVEAALKAIPLGVMIGIVTPAVAAGKLPEMLGLLAVIVAMKLTHKDIVAAVAGAATVALCRYFVA